MSYSKQLENTDVVMILDQKNDETPEDLSRNIDSCLTCFQSSPLGMTTHSNPGIVYQIPQIDLHLDKKVIQNAFNEDPSSNVSVSFEYATLDRLATFFQELSIRNREHQRRANLHFSCHGEKDYLCVDDGFGSLVPLRIADLKRWLRPVSASIHFVFVATCNSLSFTEAAVIETGVKHAICAASDETKVNGSYILEFTRLFYSSHLLSGAISIQVAFDGATTQLSMHPSYRELGPQLCLLPKGEQHDVPLFGTSLNSETPSALVVPRRPVSTRFPKPPRYFVRRDIDVWNILRHLNDETIRVVWVTGATNVGKTTVVKAACRCLKQRIQNTHFDGIFWIQLYVAAAGQETCSLGRFGLSLSDLETLALHDESIVVVLETKHLPGKILLQRCPSWWMLPTTSSSSSSIPRYSN